MTQRGDILSLEDIRTFFVRRPWLHGRFVGPEWEGPEGVLSESEYQQIKDRQAVLSVDRLAYLSAFINGYKAARP